MQYILYFNNTRCIAGFEFNSKDSEENLRFYDFVEAQKDFINAEFGKPVNWHRNADSRRSVIEIESNEFSLDDENTWDDAVNFMITNLNEFKKILQPILERYKKSSNALSIE